jgi:hypothetical protein
MLTTRKLFVFILFALVFMLATREVGDPDFWWHLRTGQYIAETGTIPHTDIFSFTNIGKEWVTHEWLSEIAMFWLYRVGGINLLIVAFSLLITVTFWFLYLCCEGKPHWAGFTILLGVFAAAPILGVRPQIFTFLLGSIWLYLLGLYIQRCENRILVFFPLSIILWVNLHSGYALGLVILALYITGEIGEIVLRWLRRQVDHGMDRETSIHLKALSITFIASIAAVVINPNGVRMYIYPFETLSSSAMQTYIQEWFSPDFHLAHWQPFAWLILLTIATALLTPSKSSATQVILLVFFGYAALRSVRNIPFFILVAIPLISRQLNQLFERFNFNEEAYARRSIVVINVVLAIIIIAVAFLRVQTVSAEQANYEKQTFPVAAVEWIAKNKPEGNIYNTYDWGGYLIWKLYPEYKVFIDGRADVYGDVFIRNYLTIYRAEQGWNEKLINSNVRVVLIKPDAPLADAMRQMSNWEIVYKDEQSILYIKEP